MPFNDILLNDGTTIPSIAFGSGSANKSKDVREYIENAIEAGFSHLDTAQFYGNEESLGIAIKESGLARSEIYVTTKWSKFEYSVRESLEASLSKMNLKYVNLFLVHFPALFRDKPERFWRQFEQLREEGLTKSIGVSNFQIEDLEKLIKIARVMPAVNQVQFHPYNWAQNKRLLDFHTKHGIVTEAFSCLTPITTYPGGPVDAALEKAAKRLKATPTQIIFAWVKAKGAVIVTTTSKKEHLREYLAAGDLPDLTPDEIAAIDEAGSRGPPSFLSQKHAVLFWLLIIMAATLNLLIMWSK